MECGRVIVIVGEMEKSGADVRFAEIEDDSPRNAAISTGKTEAVSDENGANFAVGEF